MKHHHKWIVISVLGIIGIFVFIYSGALHEVFDRWHLIPQPEAFTELYFNDPESLPTRTVAGKAETFSFVVHNEEHMTMQYPYVVYFTDEHEQQYIFTQGTVSLGIGENITIPISHTFQKDDQHGSVVVLLPELDQHIDFLLPNTN